MIHLIRILSGRLAIILGLEAITAWILIMVGNSIWENKISAGGLVTTMIIMSISIFAHQERKLGANVTWMTTLPLAKWQVWLLNYALRFSAVIAMFALAIAISLCLPPRYNYQNEPISVFHDFFGGLITTSKSFLSLFGIPFKTVEPQSLNNSMIFVMIVGAMHFYSGVLRFSTGQGRVLNIVILIGSLWGGFLLLAVGNASIVFFEAFIMVIAACFMSFSAHKNLQMPIKNLWPPAVIIVSGWALLIGPQVVKAWRNLHTAQTVDEFVDAHKYLGASVKLTGKMFHYAFRLPGDGWKVRELARTYTKDENWDNNPLLPAEGDTAFTFLDSVKAQTNVDSAIAVLLIVKPETLTARHINAFSKHIVTLSKGKYRDDDLYRIAAAMAKAEVSDQQIKSWLDSDNEDLRFAAITYPRFKPSETTWRILIKYYNRANQNELNAIRTTASVIKGAWINSEDISKLNESSLFNQQTNRSICSKSFKKLICSTTNACQNTPKPETESCFASAGISYSSLNSCLYAYSLDASYNERLSLIRAGWIHPLEIATGIVTGVTCDSEYYGQ